MRIGIGAPPKGSPGTGASTVVRLLTGEPWLTNRPDGRQTERIATGWEWDQAGTTLRLKLRKDVYFHDGERLTPEIAAEVLRLSAKNPGRDGSSFASVTSISPSGDDAIEIKLSEPNSFLLSDLSGVLVVKPGKPDIGTGPFQIVSRTDQDAALNAFPRYYRGRPGVSGIEILNYPTQRKAWTALMRGEIDMLHEVSREALDFVEAETTVKAYSFPRPYYIPLVFNVGRPILKQIEVRKALNEALDKETLVRDGMKGRGRPADGPIWPEHWAYSASTQRFAFDPEAARRRLDAAGLKAKPRPDGTVPPRFSFTCLVYADDTRFDRLAVLVQKQLADIGVDMKLQPVALEEFGKRAAAGDFDAFLFELAGRSLGRVYEFWRPHDGSLMNSGYRAADAAFERIRASRTDEETRAAVSELERILHADPPAAFLVWQLTSRAVSTKFDVAAEKNRDILTNVWQWRPADAPKRASR
jgi:peptide/nickel transport system substrate-binding protein